jgi:cobalt-zinc-cadmium resistance protein CzcA
MVLVQNNIDSNKLLNHPQIEIHNLKNDYIKQDISLQKTKLLPEISVGYFNQQIDNVRGFEGFEVGLSIPLWFVPEANNISISKIEYDKSINNLEYLKRNYYNKYTSILRKLEQIQERIKYFEDVGIRNVEENILLTTKLFNSGEIEYIEYIQNLNDALNIKKEYLATLLKYNQIIAEINYYN